MRYCCVLALVLAAGCIQVEETLTLNADGSGTMHLSYGMAREQVDQLAQAVDEARHMEEAAEGNGITATDAESPLDFDEDSIRESFKDFEPFGVTLDSVDSEVVDGWKFVRLKIRFDDLRGLARTTLMSERRISLKRNAEGNYVLRQTSGTAGEPASDTPSADMDDFMKQLMKGFKVAVSVETPGRVLETSAPQQSGNRATWEYDLEKDAQAVAHVGNLDMWVIFEGDGLDLPEFQSVGSKGD